MKERLSARLWFDVETRYKTTYNNITTNSTLLWFDVETRYKTTNAIFIRKCMQLWFDVETRYKTTPRFVQLASKSCGLM